MNEPQPYLPGVLGLISEEVGVEVAVKLARARGGRPVYIPQNPKTDMELVKIVGIGPARAISKLLGHGNLLVPLGSFGGEKGRHERIRRMWREGFPMAEIAAEVDVHLRTVERVIAACRDERQQQLPFD